VLVLIDDDKRFFQELYLRNNLQRLSDKTISRLVEDLEDEIEEAIDKLIEEID